MGGCMSCWWDNALRLMSDKHIKQADIIRAPGRSNATVSDWVSKGAMPRVDDGLAIADLLGVSVRLLVTGKDDSDLSEREKELLRVCSILPDDKFKAVVDVAKIMRKDVQEASSGGSSSGDSAVNK